MATAKQTTIRFSAEDLAILAAIQAGTGIFSRSDALRYALRYYARAEGLTVAKPKPKPRGKR